jgi:hypothetical protein
MPTSTIFSASRRGADRPTRLRTFAFAQGRQAPTSGQHRLKPGPGGDCDAAPEVRSSLLVECFVDRLGHEVGMKFSSIAITALLSLAFGASPLLAQSSLVPRASGHVPKVTGGSGSVLVPGRAPRRHGFNRSGGNRFGFGFGSGFAFGDAKGFGIGHSDHNGGHDRRWRGRHSGRYDDREDGIIGYGGGYDEHSGSYAATAPSPDQFGFFGNGGEVAQVNGRAIYDYDRSYPYEYYRGPRREQAAADGASAGRATAGCETQWVPDGRGGGDVPVRICRR